MEVKIISRESIKPTSPTPYHLKVYKVSLLDQIIPPVYFPLVVYFAPDPRSSNAASLSQQIQLLKDSLALTLTHFYPFAGVIRDALSVDCNDEGLPFFVAKVNGQLRDFLEHPDIQLINRFLPCEFTWHEGALPGTNVGTIQLNCFDCGGMAIGMILAHQIADITTLCTFLRAWAASAQGSAQVISPNYISQSAFQQKTTLQKESFLFLSLQKFLSTGKFVTRRYVFDANAISTLKAQSTTSNDKQPTRVEVVSALLWKCFMAAVAEKCSTDQKPFLLTHPVNLRRRGEPPFPSNSFGNFLWLAAAKCTNPIGTNLEGLVNEVKRAISRIDKEFVQRLQGDHGYHEKFEELQNEMPEEAHLFAFSSWSKIGLYDIDFGWGQPLWVSGFLSGDSDSLLPNSAVLIETRSGYGIEAWVILDQKYDTAFGNNEELQAYALLNPSAWQPAGQLICK